MPARILIAEDDQTSARLLEITLTRGGYIPIKTVASGPTAVEVCGELHPDIVMMDINMPGSFDGIEAARRIYTDYNIPVVYITANSSDSIIKKALTTSPMGYVLKPFNREMLFTMIEISLYKHKIETELSQSQQQLNSTLEALSEGVLSVNEGFIVFINQAARNLLFLQSDDELSKPINELLKLKDELTNLEINISDLNSENDVFSGEFLLENLAGINFPVNIKIVDNKKGSIKTRVISIRDISLEKAHQNELLKLNEELERKVIQRTGELRKNNIELEREVRRRRQIENELVKALEKEKEINEYKSNIVNTISHEFRTPITSIQSSAELMERSVNNDDKTDITKLNRHLEIIKRSVKGVLDLLSEILLMNKLEANNQEIEKVSINPEVFFDELIQQYKDGIGRRHTIDYQHNEFPLSYSTSPVLLKHIINNLMSNAFKYSEAGKIVWLVVMFGPNGIKITVKDQGIGIPAENLNHLFDAFYRGKNVVNLEGTGIGLSILQNALNQLGGKIQVSSKMDEGSTFTVQIPSL